MEGLFRNLIGQPPLGYEVLEYFVSAMVFLILFNFVADVFRSLTMIFRR